MILLNETDDFTSIKWFSSHFQCLFLIFKLLFSSSCTYSSDSSVSYCINFYLLLYVMRFCRCRWGFISKVLQNVAGSWRLWIIPDDVGVIRNKHTSFSLSTVTREGETCVFVLNHAGEKAEVSEFKNEATRGQSS